MSSSVHGWWEIEYSPSDRSLCKNCSATIHVGTARIRERSRRRNSRGAGGVSSRTFHIACFIPKARNNVVAVYWHDFKGFFCVQPEDREELIQRLIDILCWLPELELWVKGTHPALAKLPLAERVAKRCMAVERWLRDARHKRPILPFTFPTIINDDRWTDDKPVVPGRFEAGWVKYKHKKRSMEIEQEEREKEEAMEKKKKQEEEEAEREEGHYEKKRKRDNEEERRGKGKEKEEGEKEKEKEVDAGEAGEEEARAQKKVRIDVEQESFWSVIPPEIVLNYSAYLPLDDIARYSQTCKQIYSMLQDETFWKHLYVQRFGLPRVILDPTIPWKTRYKNKHLSFYTTHIAWSRYLLHIARFSDSDEEVLGMMELEHLKELCRIHRLSDSPASRATLQRLLLDSLRKGDVKELFPRSIFEPLFQLLDQQQIEK